MSAEASQADDDPFRDMSAAQAGDGGDSLTHCPDCLPKAEGFDVAISYGGVGPTEQPGAGKSTQYAES